LTGASDFRYKPDRFSPPLAHCWAGRDRKRLAAHCRVFFFGTIYSTTSAKMPEESATTNESPPDAGQPQAPQDLLPRILQANGNCFSKK